MPELAIVGGGLASARAVKAYREAGGAGDVLLVSRDSVIPYHRPPLSKRYLRGEAEREDTLVEDQGFYDEHEVEVRLETAVAALHAARKELALEDGERVPYRRLLIATGATPRRLDVPGADRDGVFTLRTLDDSTRIRDAARGSERAVVVGAGFIGMEIAASLTQLGVQATLVHRGDGLFESLGSPELSRHLVDLYRERGVELVLSDEVAEFRGNGRVSAAVTKAGRELGADLAVAGVGVTPNVEFLAGSGLELDNGIVVDDGFAASLPDVYAAGDVANFYDPVFDRRRRIEHWSNANYQGSQVGKVLAGEPGRYDVVSSFFTEVFGLSLKVFGDTTRTDERVSQGAFAEGAAVDWCLEEGRLVGAVLTGQDEESENRIKALIRARASAAELA
ncbi:MAG: NAD(P)/FAD-dependent oxidoreductase [Gaiellaceae bacterium]